VDRLVPNPDQEHADDQLHRVQRGLLEQPRAHERAGKGCQCGHENQPAYARLEIGELRRVERRAVDQQACEVQNKLAPIRLLAKVREMAALPVWSNPVFVRTAQPEAIPNMFPANVPLLSRKVAKSLNSSALFGVVLTTDEPRGCPPWGS
jgi:hypothetical protein